MNPLNLLLVLALAVYTVSGQQQPLSEPNCGRRPLFQPSKIVNGTEAIPGDWGWTVSITRNGNHFCGGILFNKRFVLTAGHCLAGNSIISNLQVVIGVHNRQQPESWVQRRSVAAIRVHEQYNSFNLRQDIAIIKLASDVVFDDKYIVPVCMPEDAVSQASDKRDAWVVGWGYQKFGGVLFARKQQVEMPILTGAQCTAMYNGQVAPASQICAGDENVGLGACQGDSGGPFSYEVDGKHTVVGIVSWGYDCGQGTVYTRVSFFLNWIRDKMAIM